jgi:hypothetical protein
MACLFSTSHGWDCWSHRGSAAFWTIYTEIIPFRYTTIRDQNQVPVPGKRLQTRIAPSTFDGALMKKFLRGVLSYPCKLHT